MSSEPPHAKPFAVALDHLVYATPDLERSVDDLEARLGVRAAPGGPHPGRGTRNAIIALSDRSYLEIIGPDPAQSMVAAPRWFGIDALAAPRLCAWAASVTAIDALTAEARRRGVELGQVVSGRRVRPDGLTLRWKCTEPDAMVGDGLVPFLIDWGDGPHPAQTAPGGVSALELRGTHPSPERIMRLLAAVGFGITVERGPHPALCAMLESPRGVVELR